MYSIADSFKRRAASLRMRIESLSGLRKAVSLPVEHDIGERRWFAIESELKAVEIRLSRRLKRVTREYFSSLNDKKSVRVLNSLFGEIELEMAKTYTVFDTFMDVLTQRNTPELGGLPVGGVSAGAGFMQIFGSGYLPPMDVGYTDVDAKVLKPKVPKAGGKALPFGKIWKKDFKDFDATKSIAITDYAGAYNLKDDTHFCLGSAVLTEDARQALRIVCANELVAFSSPATTLSIIGHTDRVDTSERNLTLSALCAENTLQAIKDILGANFKIPDSNIKELSGKGENEAIKDNRPDNKPEPKYRRVDVFLDTRLIISLKAL